jgi:MYXO-CTERM domain-containing protein
MFHFIRKETVLAGLISLTGFYATSAATAAPLPLNLPLKFDMGTVAASGWTGVGSGVSYGTSLGYGWISSVSTVLDATNPDSANGATDPNVDFAYASSAKVFYVDLGMNQASIPGFNAPGKYTITAPFERVNVSLSVTLKLYGGDNTQLLDFETDHTNTPSVTLTSDPINVLADHRLVITLNPGPYASTSGFAGGWILNSLSVAAVPTPEPMSLGLISLGGLLLLRRRR